MARRQSRSYQFNPMASKGTQNNIEKTLVRFVRFFQPWAPGLIFNMVFLIASEASIYRLTSELRVKCPDKHIQIVRNTV